MNDALFDAKLKEALLLAATVDYAEVLSEPEGAELPWTLPYRRQRKKMLADPNKWCRERVADSVELYQDTKHSYSVGFVPEGYVLKESGRYSANPYELNASGKWLWVTAGGSLAFLYTESHAAPLQSGDGEPVTLKIGNQHYEAHYYAPVREYQPIMQDNTPEPTVEVIDGKYQVIYPEYDPADYPPTVRTDAMYPRDMCGAICWTNEDGVQMMVQGTQDRETLLKVAESVTSRAFLTEGGSR